MSMTRATYETDVDAWTQEQVAALQAKDFTRLDIAPLAEAIDHVGTRVPRAIGRHTPASPAPPVEGV